MGQGSGPEGRAIAQGAAAAGARRLRLTVRGAVQGVGFRPFVYRLATALDLAGWVLNDSRGVFLEVEGPEPRLRRFRRRLEEEAPPRSVIHSLEEGWLEPAGFERFEIRHSDEAGSRTVVVLPDIATCPSCLAEVRDPPDRRHRYPFTNCTDCGPRFTIVLDLPYDRPATTMRGFEMCPDCATEYADPLDRRFHAQPNACPRCGPSLALLDGHGAELARRDDALRRAAAALREGRIVAVKGLGGFHLLVDAADGEAVERLRRRKRRWEKPLALMAADPAAVRRLCRLSGAEAETLESAEAPIVLLDRCPGAPVADAVAPGNPRLGVMLPPTPLHHLLLAEVGRPVVATSGNLSDEPIAIDDAEAVARLGSIADLFLVHDRPIARHADDSLVQVTGGEPRLLRRARGYAPLPLTVAGELPTVLAVGAHLKNAVALALGNQVFVSQHVGDMETPRALAAFERVSADFLRLYEARPAAVAHDLHPDYATSRWARAATATGGELAGARAVAVQHHHAHLASCLLDAGVAGPALGITWDGTGDGGDGTVWGGEALLGDAAGFRRVGALRPFRLPGGEAAVREPRRVALALLWELGGAEAVDPGLPPAADFPEAERAVLLRMLERGLNAPVTTSAGRLFDGVAALVGIRQRTSFEGQAAMELEFAAGTAEEAPWPLPVAETGEGRLELDRRPLVEALLADSHRGADPGIMAARFHAALAAAIVALAEAVGEPRVALTGGCFQNRRLAESAARGLAARGFEVLQHRRVPPGDGGIALGQVAVAAAALERQEPAARKE